MFLSLFTQLSIIPTATACPSSGFTLAFATGTASGNLYPTIRSSRHAVTIDLHHDYGGANRRASTSAILFPRRVGYDGYITIELYPYAEDPDFAARTARERVLEIIRKLDTP